MKYTPDKWVIVELRDNGKVHYRVFGTWLEGYTDGEAWRMNSGNKEVHKAEDGTYHVFGYSGSCYFLDPRGYGTSAYTGGVLRELALRSAGALKVFSEEQSLRYLDDAAKE